MGPKQVGIIPAHGSLEVGHMNRTKLEAAELFEIGSSSTIPRSCWLVLCGQKPPPSVILLCSRHQSIVLIPPPGWAHESLEVVQLHDGMCGSPVIPAQAYVPCLLGGTVS